MVSCTTVSPLPRRPARTGGGLFSVALSRGSPRVAVGHHLALWSPDLPRHASREVGMTRSPGRPVRSAESSAGGRVDRASACSFGTMTDSDGSPRSTGTASRTTAVEGQDGCDYNADRLGPYETAAEEAAPRAGEGRGAQRGVGQRPRLERRVPSRHLPPAPGTPAQASPWPVRGHGRGWPACSSCTPPAGCVAPCWAVVALLGLCGCCSS